MKTLENKELTEAEKGKLYELAAKGLNLDEIAKKSGIQAARLWSAYSSDKTLKDTLTGARRIAAHPFIKEYFNALKKMGELAFARRDKALISGIDRYIGRLEWLIQRLWPELFTLPTPQAQLQEIAAAAQETITPEQEERIVHSIAQRQARLAKLELEELEANSDT